MAIWQQARAAGEVEREEGDMAAGEGSRRGGLIIRRGEGSRRGGREDGDMAGEGNGEVGREDDMAIWQQVRRGARRAKAMARWARGGLRRGEGRRWQQVRWGARRPMATARECVGKPEWCIQIQLIPRGRQRKHHYYYFHFFSILVIIISLGHLLHEPVVVVVAVVTTLLLPDILL